MTFIEMLKGYMARESLGSPALKPIKSVNLKRGIDLS